MFWQNTRIWVVNFDRGFLQRCYHDLNKIHNTTIGRELLELIDKRCVGIGTRGAKRVTIQPVPFTTIGKSKNTILLSDEARFNKTSAKASGLDPGARIPRPAYLFPILNEGTLERNIRSPFSRAGMGSDVVVSYINSEINQGGITKSSDEIYTMMNGLDTKGFIVLAHELIHALHILSGNSRNAHDEEEQFTVGLGRYEDSRITENALRTELGLPRRLSHG
jgi:Effector protein